MENKREKKKIKIRKNSILRKICLVTILLIIVLNILRYSAYFKRDTDLGIDVSIQNDVNIELVNDIYIDENKVVYFSEEDMKKYFDKELYFEKNDNNLRRYISISQNKILDITENQNHIFINGVRQKIKAAVVERNSVYYFPISELETVYNIKVDYLEDKNKINIEKLSEEKKVGIVNRNTKLKYKMTDISKNIDELEQGENVTIIEEMNKKWVKIKTSDYMIGYLKKNRLTNIENERNNLGKLDFSNINLDTASVIDIKDESYENINNVITNYDDRKACIQEILKTVTSEISKLEGKEVVVKIDIKNIENIENYYRFLKELKAYLNDVGVGLVIQSQPNLDINILQDVVDVII